MQEKPRVARSNVRKYNEQLPHIPKNRPCPVIRGAMEHLNCCHDSAGEYGTVLEICTCTRPDSFTEDHDGKTCCEHPSNRTPCQKQSTIHLTCKSKFGITRMKLISKLHLGTDFLMIVGLYSQHILFSVLPHLCLMETLCRVAHQKFAD